MLPPVPLPRLGAPGLALLMGLISVTGSDSADGVEFFETRIRPLLIERCYECHSPERKVKGGLRLDTREGWAAGGDTGPAIVPGEPEKSLLITAVRYLDPEFQMPPKHRLTPSEVAALEAWVKMGAPDPRVSGPAPVVSAPASPTKHWSYQALTEPKLPAVRDAAWPRVSADHFLLSKMEERGLHPAPDADAATLCRRIYFDLIGLPPSPEEMAEFQESSLTDGIHMAQERLVTRLLASPHFGERWGRHWLDLARFAESTGGGRTMILSEAWRYRDYVIDAFNRDLPFDQFLREQIAGDLLPSATPDDRRRQLVATTFLAIGPTNYEEQDKKQLRMDVVDEQLDTIGRAFLAQTIGCARCHDHKFDPIPTRDYYALAGIFRSTKTLVHSNVSNWIELPLPLPADEERTIAAHEAAVAALQAKIKDAKEAANARGKGSTVAVPSAPANLPGIVVDDADARTVGEWKHSTFMRGYIGTGYLHDLAQGKGEKTLTFTPRLPRSGRYEVRLAYNSDAGRASNVPVTIFHADGEETVRVNERIAPPIDRRFVSVGTFPLNEASYVLISNEGTDGYVIADAVQFLSTDQPILPATLEPARAPAGDVAALEAELKRLTKDGPKRPMAISVKEEDKIEDAPIHIRGSVSNLGTSVPRGFLQCGTIGAAPAVPESESGRRQLAEWLASPAHPLTARVLVNRVWSWVFGEGLVRTLDNFGTTGEAPSHPELLDYLASRFAAEGWSVKTLVRELMLSRAYGLSGAHDAASIAADPANRLLARASRRRVPAEGLRDTMLLISGNLQREPGGPGIASGTTTEYGYKFSDFRRSVYTPVFRNALPDLFAVFDFASPNLGTGKRNESTVPDQALFLLNHPFVREQAQAAARRALAATSEDAQRLERAYRETLSRAPSAAERELALRHTRSHAADPAQAWTEIYHALFASLDFRYVE